MDNNEKLQETYYNEKLQEIYYPAHGVIDKRAHELRELRAKRDALDEEIKQIEDEFKEMMNESEVYRLRGDDWSITWNSVSSNRFNQSLFKKAHPELFQEFQCTSSSRRFLFN